MYGRVFVATADIAIGTQLFEFIGDVPAEQLAVRGEKLNTQRSLEVEQVVNADVNRHSSVNRREYPEARELNARFVDSRKVVAIRAIQQGELIRIDPRREPVFATDLTTRGDEIVSGGISIVLGFLTNALRHEWGAAVVSFVSAIPSNVLSCFIVIWGASWLKEQQVFESEAAYVSAVSILTGFVGYATYLIGYYGGMLIKEKADLFEKGVFSWQRFRRKCRVIWYDFFIHLPSDFYSLPLLSVGQGGMYVAGVSQFWSIFWAQAIADAFSAVKEPFFWHGAKKLAELTERHVSNEDQFSAPADRVGNE